MKISRTFSALLLALVLLTAPAALLAQTAQPQGVPAHPKELKYTTLTFNPPKRDKYRHVLSNGVVVYAVEDHDLPLVNISTLVRTGTYLEPAEKVGLAGLVGSQMRAGGAGKMTAEQFDEAADFLAAQLSSGVGSTQGNANLPRGQAQARQEPDTSVVGAAQRQHDHHRVARVGPSPPGLGALLDEGHDEGFRRVDHAAGPR